MSLEYLCAPGNAYRGLVDGWTIVPREEVFAPAMPLDLEAAKNAGKVRRQSAGSV